MLTVIVVALWMTMMLSVLLDSARTQAVYSQIQQVNQQLENRLMNLTAGAGSVSVFAVRDFRNALSEEFVKPRLVDELELYLVDPHHIHMKYRKESAEQEFEILIAPDRFKMETVFDNDGENFDYRV